MYDVIVVGARAAGAPTAMLLARRGIKVLLVDRMHFPVESPLANLIQLKGCAALQRWGLLERVFASNCPPVSRALLQVAQYSLQGDYPAMDGIQATACPRRSVLDRILVEAALEAGVELRPDLLVEGLLTDNDQVTGIRARLKSDQAGEQIQVQEKAALVIGADGKHSQIARAVQAPEYRAIPGRTCIYYTYWADLGLVDGELYYLNRQAIGLWPTNDGLVNIFVAYPADQLQSIRADIRTRFWQTVECVPGLLERLRNGRQVERFYGTADLPSFYRRPYGRGWALVGDAGMTLDPFTGQGIGNAFLDAERLAEAVEAVFSARKSFDQAMAGYERRRNADTLPMYEFTSGLASFGSIPGPQNALLAALEKKTDGASWVLGALTGSISIKELFSPASLLRMIGLQGFLKVLFPYPGQPG